MKHALLLKCFCYFLIATLLYTLPSTSNAQSANESQLKQVRIDIGHKGLSCPNLEPQFEKKLKQVPGVQCLKVNQKEGYLTFELASQSSVTGDELKQIGVKLGYPANDVTVTFCGEAALKTDAGEK